MSDSVITPAEQALATKYPSLAIYSKRRKTSILFYEEFAKYMDSIYKKVLANKFKPNLATHANSVIHEWGHGTAADKEYATAALKDINNGVSAISKSRVLSEFGKEALGCTYYQEVSNPHYKSAPPMCSYYPSVLRLFLLKDHTKGKVKTGTLIDWLSETTTLTFFGKNKKLVLFAKTEEDLNQLADTTKQTLDPALSPELKNNPIKAKMIENLLRKNKICSLYLTNNGDIIFDDNSKATKAYLATITSRSLAKKPRLKDLIDCELSSQKVDSAQRTFAKKQQMLVDLKEQKNAFFQKNIRRFLVDKEYKGNKVFEFFVGPTNSGKTYAALQEITSLLKCNPKAKIAYLAPLRLLAIEIFEKTREMGLKCTLRTGEETIYVEDAQITSSTVEMLDSEQYDLVLIDEYQMYSDKDRGQAWIRAILNNKSPRTILIGSDDCVGEIRYLIEKTLPQSQVAVKTFTRMSELKTIRNYVSLDNFKPGDALVVFSKNKVLQYANLLNDKGYKVSVLYGDLPLETRRLNADDFKSGKTDILVSTDVIGMGLNLPINRIIFESCDKYDGEKQRPLTLAEFKQICGRAGRGQQDGFFGLLNVSNLSYSPSEGTIVNEKPNDEGGYSRYSRKPKRSYYDWDDYDWDDFDDDYDYIPYEYRRYPIKQTGLISYNPVGAPAEDFTAKKPDEPFLLAINSNLLHEYMKEFNLSLKHGYEEYLAFFRAYSGSNNQQIEHCFSIVDTLNEDVLKLINRVMGANYTSLNNRFEVISSNLGSEFGFNTLLSLCTPPITFYKKVNNGYVSKMLTPPAHSFLCSLHSILTGDIALAKKGVLQDSKIDYYASTKIDRLGLKTDSHHYSKNKLNLEVDEYATDEKILILTSWLNKHVPLLDESAIRQARFSIALHMFAMIRCAFMRTQKSTPQEVLDIQNKKSVLLSFIRKYEPNKKKRKKKKKQQQPEQPIVLSPEILAEIQEKKKQVSLLDNELSALKASLKKQEQQEFEAMIDELLVFGENRVQNESNIIY